MHRQVHLNVNLQPVEEKPLKHRANNLIEFRVNLLLLEITVGLV